jgi:K+-sensing histidine kinase KdpD
MSEQRETLTDLLLQFDTHFVDIQKKDNIINTLVKDIAELRRQNDVFYSVLKRVAKNNSTKADIQKFYLENRDTVKADESIIRYTIDEYKKSMKDIDTVAQWEYYKDELKKLGVYDEMMSFIK